MDAFPPNPYQSPTVLRAAAGVTVDAADVVAAFVVDIGAVALAVVAVTGAVVASGAAFVAAAVDVVALAAAAPSWPVRYPARLMLQHFVPSSRPSSNHRDYLETY